MLGSCVLVKTIVFPLCKFRAPAWNEYLCIWNISSFFLCLFFSSFLFFFFGKLCDKKKFCHHLLTLILFKSHMTDSLLWNTKCQYEYKYFPFHFDYMEKHVQNIACSFPYNKSESGKISSKMTKKSIIKIVQLLKQYDSFECYSLKIFHCSKYCTTDSMMFVLSN